MLPTNVLRTLSLRGRETPSGYELLRDRAMLTDLGLSANPSYVVRPSDVELVGGSGGLASFLSLYGRGDQVCLVINGVYFRDPERCATFADLQRAKHRQVVAYRRSTTHGIWLLLVARNPARTCDDAELASIRRGLDRYARRLRLEVVFDELDRADAS